MRTQVLLVAQAVGAPLQDADLAVQPFEELRRPGLAVLIPKLSEGLFQHIGHVEPLVGLEHDAERLPAVERFSRRESSVYFCPLM
jgi:hypothetical protein